MALPTDEATTDREYTTLTIPIPTTGTDGKPFVLWPGDILVVSVSPECEPVPPAEWTLETLPDGRRLFIRYCDGDEMRSVATFSHPADTDVEGRLWVLRNE